MPDTSAERLLLALEMAVKELRQTQRFGGDDRSLREVLANVETLVPESKNWGKP